MSAPATGRPAPVRPLRRSLFALLFLYAVAFVVAVVAGIKCQGAAPWRGGGDEAAPARAPR